MDTEVKQYSIGSLFAGIGGFELGLERAIPGAYTLWQVEQNLFCQKVLAKHWPEAKIYDDVRNITKNNVEQVDILCGGFPCQDISVLGKGEGLNGTRSGLWWEMHRIIDELQPKAVIMENVAAITVRGLGTVLGSLSQIGYDAEWCTIRASDFGAPHHRARWFCIAYPTNSNRSAEAEHKKKKEGYRKSSEGYTPGQEITKRWQEYRRREALYNFRHCDLLSNQRSNTTNPIKGRCEEYCNEQQQTIREACSMLEYSNRRVSQGESITYSYKENYSKRDVSSERMEERYSEEKRSICTSSESSSDNTRGGYWEQFPTTSPVCGRDDGIPNRVDRIGALGNAIVPQCSEWIGKKLWESGILQAQSK